MNDNMERAFEWDSEIEQESSFELLPKGECDFVVEKFERARHNGSEKLPPCPKAIVYVKVTAPNGRSSTIPTNLFLHSKCEGLLSAFFISIGQKKHGEKLKMNWAMVPGARGRCLVDIRTYTKDDGTEGQANEIKRFLEPKADASTAQKQFTVGQF